MERRTAYCSACDRDVQIVVTDGPSQDGHANLHDAELVCLEIGERCTGNLCPVGATSPAVMASRLVHNGLDTPVHPHASLWCEDCGRVTSQMLIEPKLSTCTECGATRQRSVAAHS